jgi:hypothetical protein
VTGRTEALFLGGRSVADIATEVISLTAWT